MKKKENNKLDKFILKMKSKYQKINKLIKTNKFIDFYQPPFEYQSDCIQNKFECIHLFYSYTLSSLNRLDDYTVMLIEGDKFKFVFNCAHIEKKLYEMLAPLMNENTQFCFTNIIKIEDYYRLCIVFNYLTSSSLSYSSFLFYQIIYLYPYQIASQKAELINIRNVIRSFLKCDIDKRMFSLCICSAIIDDYRVMSILERKCCDFIVFKNCTIISTYANLNKYSIKQKCIFDSCVFQNKEDKIDENDFIARIYTFKNKKGELFYFNFKEDEKIINLLEKYVLFIKKTNSFNFYLQRKLRFLISYFNSFKSKIEDNCINIQLNPNSDSYSLLIKVIQSSDAEEYSERKICCFVIGTMCINIFKFLSECECDIDIEYTL